RGTEVVSTRLVDVSEHFHQGKRLTRGWQWCSHDAGACATPAELGSAGFADAAAPSTVAGELRAHGALSRDAPPDLDGRDRWYRLRFGDDRATSGQSGRQLLVFDGLASIATVWLNGEQVLATENMFRRYAIDVSDLLEASNELVIRFAALTPELMRRKGRRRWPTRLVNHRNLRF